MTYRLVKNCNDKDIPTILSVYKQPSICRFISIDEENYWTYITSTNNVYFYKVYKNDIFVAAIHLEVVDRVLYMSVVVFPKFQKQGIATTILKDIQAGKTGLDFDKIQVSIDEKNTASLRLFESVGFICLNKGEELLEYEYSKSLTHYFRMLIPQFCSVWLFILNDVMRKHHVAARRYIIEKHRNI